VAQFVIAPEAIRDLDEISDYFVIHNVDVGEKLFEQFEKKCRYLVQFPNIGRSYRAIRSYLRELPLDGYIIFYRVSGDGIEILRIVKGNRDLESLFDGEVPE